MRNKENSNSIIYQKGDSALETTHLRYKGAFDITGRDCLSREDTAELIKELDKVIQKHSDVEYHVRLFFFDSK